MQKNKRGKSRLRAYKRKILFHNLSTILILGTIFAWLSVFAVLTEKQQVEAYEYHPPVIIEKVDHSLTEKEQILNYIVEVFGEDAADAITIINKCENHAFDPKATNWNSNGTWDAGIFQVNEIHGYTIEQMKDWKQNIDAAKIIFDGRGWEAWACSNHVGVKSFWQ